MEAMVSRANSGETNRRVLAIRRFSRLSHGWLPSYHPETIPVDGKLVCEEAFTRAALQACLFKPALHPLGARADEVIE